jgi:hypothetical protein
MTGKKPPDASGGTKIVTSPGEMVFDNSKKLTNETPGEKILLMKRNVSMGTNNALSPFLVTRAVEGVAQGKVSKISWLRDGSILIKTKNLKQAERLVRLIALSPEVHVEIIEHPRLNFSKGVIRTNLLKSVSDAEFLTEMKDQNVFAIHRIKRKMNVTEVETGTYFLTFSSCEPPKSINICYEMIEIREFTPSPMRCWNFLAFNHTKSTVPKIRPVLSVVKTIISPRNLKSVKPNLNASIVLVITPV